MTDQPEVKPGAILKLPNPSVPRHHYDAYDWHAIVAVLPECVVTIQVEPIYALGRSEDQPHSFRMVGPYGFRDGNFLHMGWVREYITKRTMDLKGFL